MLIDKLKKQKNTRNRLIPNLKEWSLYITQECVTPIKGEITKRSFVQIVQNLHGQATPAGRGFPKRNFFKYSLNTKRDKRNTLTVHTFIILFYFSCSDTIP